MAFGSIKALLDKTGNHQRNNPTADSQGGDVAAWSTINAGVKMAIWPAESNVANDYLRRDIVVNFSICTDVDLAARPSDRIVVGSDYYIVMGLEPYSNFGLVPHPIYIMHCQKRTA